jgi:acyl-CoA synthetase (AMP-forming)/AMP-acid ligase II
VQHATGTRYAAAQTLGRGTIIQSPIPMFTASAIMTLILPIVTSDAIFAIDHPFEPGRSLERARVEHSHVFKAVPAHYMLLTNAADRLEPVPTVRLAITTAAPLSATAFRGMRALFPNAAVRALFGSTESAGTFSIIDESQLRASLGSLGSPAPDCELDLLGPEPSSGTASEEEGDLVLRGPFPAAGYWRRPPDVARSTFLPQGGVRTGDRATRIGADYILGGRTSAVINRGGFKIDPAEIEAIVNAIPWVEDSCVISIAHEVLGEDLLLVVQGAPPPPGQPAREPRFTGVQIAELTEHLTVKLPRQKRPRHLLGQTLTRNALGKVDRKNLQTLAEGSRAQWIEIREAPG